MSENPTPTPVMGLVVPARGTGEDPVRQTEFHVEAKLDAQPWFCTGCRALGILVHTPDAGAYGVCTRLREAHRHASPACDLDPRIVNIPFFQKDEVLMDGLQGTAIVDYARFVSLLKICRENSYYNETDEWEELEKMIDRTGLSIRKET